MMMANLNRRVLLAGETWFTHGIHQKGFSAYTTGSYEEGYAEFVSALQAGGWDIDHLPNHLAVERFPRTTDELGAYDVVILSDIPADTLLLHPDTFVAGKRTPDRLLALERWVHGGGGLLMVGGYMSFSGFEGKARYQGTPLARVLPVQMLGHDDRIETPEGMTPRATVQQHPILAGLDGEWPHFLGYNRVIPTHGEVLLTFGEDPLLVVGERQSGRAAAFTSDCSPHWGSPEFMSWPGYSRFWNNLVGWLSAR
jgi:uncharacterized membrane protein